MKTDGGTLLTLLLHVQRLTATDTCQLGSLIAVL